MVYKDKIALRKELLEKRERMDDEKIDEISRVIFDKIKRLDSIQKAKTIMIYVTFGKELRTGDFISWMLEQGKTVATPICNKDRTMILAHTTTFPEGFVPTKMGIPEIPREHAVAIDPQQLDIVITPGLAFTMDGKRIGYGGGFYDRLFEKLSPQTLLICPTFDDFIVEDLPTGPYDKKVDILISEKKSVFLKKG